MGLIIIQNIKRAIMTMLKIFAFVWPFLKDTFLDGKSFRESLRDNKKSILKVLIVFFLLGLNTLTIPKLYRVSGDYLELKKEHAILQAKYLSVEKCETTPTTTEDKAPKTPVTEPPVINNQKNDKYNIKEPLINVTKPLQQMPKQTQSKKQKNNKYEDTLKDFENIQKRESVDTSVH